MVYLDVASKESEMEDMEMEVAPTAKDAGGAAKLPATTLYPFTHQVGGHSQLLMLDPSTLCKPLIQRELHYYLNIPRDMKHFTPLYKGVIQVDGNPSIYHPTSSVKAQGLAEDSARDSTTSSRKRVRAQQQLKVQIRSFKDEGQLRKEMGKQHCIDNEYSRPIQRHFLLLENVASHFQRPCILDLKMGTRQHGDDAPDEKRYRQIAKCAASTSATLGVRLCGMQVFQANIEAYICKDKYYGRSLDEEGFRKALRQFFHNGYRLRVGRIDKVVERLRELREAVERQNSFRFYSSSLLIVYEGCEESDFPEGGRHDDDDDDNCSFSWCDSHFERETEKCRCFVKRPSSEEEDSSLESSTDSADVTVCTGKCRSHRGSLRALKKHKSFDGHLVDVRMIDFAHTTHEGYEGDTTVHRGPDNGYLLGLDNLIRLLLSVKTRGNSTLSD